MNERKKEGKKEGVKTASSREKTPRLRTRTDASAQAAMLRKNAEREVFSAAQWNDTEKIRAGLKKLSDSGGKAALGRDSRGRTSLMIVAAKGNKEALELLAPWSEPEARDDRGHTALSSAVAEKRLDCARWLVENGAQTATANDRKENLLHTAAFTLDAELIGWVASLPGVDVNASDGDGETAWQFCVGNDTECARALLGKCDPMTRNANGETVLSEATHCGDEEMFGLLLPISDANNKEKNGMSVLMAAANSGMADMVRRLIAWPGVNIWDVDNQGQTALDWAVKGRQSSLEEGRRACVRWLSEIAPPEIAKAALAKHGREALPELFARWEAEKLKESLPAPDLASRPPAGAAAAAGNSVGAVDEGAAAHEPKGRANQAIKKPGGRL